MRKPPPSFISDGDKLRFEQSIRVGATAWDESGEELMLVLGLDMGTSSTKVIVRLPDETGDPAFAVPAPEPCRDDENPYLWRTVLWLQGDGTFHPWPEPDATVLNSLKQGLILARSGKAISTIPAPLTMTRAQAAVAYLSFVIRYVKNWLAHNRPTLFRGRKPYWLVNLGMPAASYDDRMLAEPYRRIAAAALKLADSGNPVTVDTTGEFLDDPEIDRAGTSSEAAEELGIAVIPETAAAMTGFAKSVRGAAGLYFMADVGAMTLDACMLRLNRNRQPQDRYHFMRADVRPLGVDSFHWFFAEGKSEAEFVQQCDVTMRHVIWRTKGDRDPYAEVWKPGNELPVFLIGGGAASPLHRGIVESLDDWLKKSAHNDGIRLLTLKVPNEIDLPEPLEHLGRMAVAWGLSFPPWEIGKIEPMSAIEDVPRRVVRDLDKYVISKDQV